MLRNVVGVLVGLVGASAVAGFGLLAQTAPAAKAPAGSALDVLRVQGNVYMIAGAGSNIAVQVGPDGVVVVDSGSGQRTPAVLAAIKALCDQPIRFVVDTGGDADHIGGNEALAKVGRSFGRGGPPIVAHEQILMRMSAPTGNTPPFPDAAMPSETFLDKKHMYLNGEGIQMDHQPAAHSDGDITAYFRRSDVVVVGEILDMTRFPIIDLAHGGSIEGEIAALNRLVDLTIPPTPLIWQEGGTKVIPARGHIAEQAEVVDYRDMVTIIRDVIQDLIAKGLTLDQVKAASPALAYARRYGATSGPWTTDMFVEAVYRDLTKEKAQPKSGTGK